ncbi:DEAD/DEAH box helicase family protein [Iamia majanohamensis]|uniref:DEAD/DEAH box helicase family protein n=1 Tax=Iamia majanohamensis TaxID=467976 RepID=A0AAE9Y8X6_9ACTN|nr:DEAD/DEAH box helicase family protein [Iamia majanohamensis]WCO68940.1 DEAD/DEAH box helicase family protein [Iamia majanohamensis]
MTIRLKFDAGLGYQRGAIASVVDLFRGLPLADAPFALPSTAGSQLHLAELGVSNPVPDDQEAFEASVLSNLRAVQASNGLDESAALDGMHFSVEMETGTGKTYVYLRTIMELHRTHGFTKFVIVVPSIAIREGVMASIGGLRDHLTDLYLEPFDVALYDSKHLGRVRQFATSTSIQILVMNIQAFQRDVEEEGSEAKANVINRAQDRLSGRRPVEFVQATHPVVIIDEPQKMESEKSAAAIDRLQPLCTLRYSATHKKPYNRAYRLGPIEAYDLNLVKRIEVASVVADDNPNAAFARLLGVDAANQRARLALNVGIGGKVTQRKKWVKVGADLSHLSGGRQEYAEGWRVADISFRPGAEAVDFANGQEVTLDVAVGAFDTDVRRAQVVETVRQHLDKEKALAAQGVKVLSLFFVDKVADYRAIDENGSRTLGPVGEWFEEAYAEHAARPRYASLGLPPVENVHDGYFSVDKKGATKDTRGESALDVDTYDLIMRDKERLLSPDEPLRFIFSHSALREGWDNPNVFQICTLSGARSTDRKRQEIGRGLRLPVGPDGGRIHDPRTNRLTVVANEAYEEFARTLQTEYEEDTGIRFGVVERSAFRRLALPSGDPLVPHAEIGSETSAELWEHLRTAGYLADDGTVTPAFRPQDDDFRLDVPDHLAAIRSDITDAISRHVFTNRVKDARARKRIGFRKQVTLDPDFKELWDKISQRTRYRVSLSSADLVEAAAQDIADAIERTPIGPPKVRVKTVEVGHSHAGLSTDTIIDQRSYETAAPLVLPDLLADLQNATDLTRPTLVAILRRSGRLGDFPVNPQDFTTLVTSRINAALHSQMVDGLTYEPVAGHRWDMLRLEQEAGEELERYASNLYEVQNQAKTPFDHVELDSDGERRFAKALDDNSRVKLFVKLPRWFTVDTPIGAYNPDWAIVLDDSGGHATVHLVRETKSTADPSKRRPDENTKVECARRHFEAIGVDYDVETDFDAMLDRLDGVST